MIDLSCPSCGCAFQPSSTLPLQEANCPRCGRSFAAATRSAIQAPGAEAPAWTAATPTTGLPAEDRETSADSVRALPSVPGYEVLAEIGRGGMGVVYKARQLNPRRLVALKMIRAGEHASKDQLARLHREAEAVARLQHPAIIQIHQVGEWQPEAGPPVPYLTLEYVAGGTLAGLLGSGPPLTSHQAADLVRQLALGVHYAHGRGIVHRDLKPANVLLQEKPEETESLDRSRSDFHPRITDFGLAKTLEGVASVAPAGPRTQSGALLGTPGYMAPEQADGKGRPVGPATDVYALGAILYECLTGRPPFVAETAVDTLLLVVREEPVPPRQVRPPVPHALETVCLKCLEKDPARRYGSALDLAEDLGRFLGGVPVRVQPPSVLGRIGRWARRHKELAYLLGGALAAAVLIVGMVVLRRPSPTAERPEPAPSQPAAPTTPADQEVLDNPFRQAAQRTQSKNNLKSLGLGLHDMHRAVEHFPPPAICSKKDGKPLLSWRVAILPWMGEDALYKQFRLDEPWDSQHNKKLLASMPAWFAIPGRGSREPYATHYQAVVGPGAIWELVPDATARFGARGRRKAEIIDGTAKTILLVEAAEAVPWTKPADVVFDRMQMPRLGGHFPGGFNALFADGHTRFLSQNIDPELLCSLITHAGGEILPPGWFD